MLNIKLNGFTLIETLVVLAIMALVVAIVPPFLPRVIQSTKVKAASWDIVSALKSTRNQAMTKQKESTLILDVEKKYFTINKKIHRLNLPDDIELSLIAADTERLNEKQAAIRFFPDGSSTGGQIKFRNGRVNYLIDVNWLTGKIKLLQ